MISPRAARRWGALIALLFSAVSLSYAAGQREELALTVTVSRPKTNPTVTVRTNPQLGKILVGPTGKTLYVYQRDGMDRSNCLFGCASLWPPLTVKDGQEPTKGPGVSGSLGTITRDNGELQVTYNGMPLYYYVADAAAGEAAGQGIQSAGGLWYVVPPQAASFKEAKTLSTHPTQAQPKNAWG